MQSVYLFSIKINTISVGNLQLFNPTSILISIVHLKINICMSSAQNRQAVSTQSLWPVLSHWVTSSSNLDTLLILEWKVPIVHQCHWYSCTFVQYYSICFNSVGLFKWHKHANYNDNYAFIRELIKLIVVNCTMCSRAAHVNQFSILSFPTWFGSP